MYTIEVKYHLNDLDRAMHQHSFTDVDLRLGEKSKDPH